MSGPRLRAIGGVLAVCLLAVAALLAGVDTSPSKLAKSGASVEPDGRLAAFAVLRKLGFEPRLFDRRPGELPREEALLLLAGRPELSARHVLESEVPPETQLGARLAGSPHGARFYRRFIDEGGVLVAPAREDVFSWLAEEVDIERIRDANLLADEERDVHAVVARVVNDAAERVARPGRYAVHWEAVRPFRPSTVTPSEVLFELDSGEPLVVRLDVGRGSLVLVPDVDFLANQRLGEADHGLFFVRLVELVTRSDTVLFDEYSAGAWRPDTPLDIAFSERLRTLAWHVLALCVALVWSAAWAREFPRDPIAVEPFSALGRARALASLYRLRRGDNASRWRSRRNSG